MKYMISEYFLTFYGLSFHFLNDIICIIKVFNFDEILFIYFFSYACAFSVICKKPWTNQCIEDLFLCFFLIV